LRCLVPGDKIGGIGGELMEQIRWHGRGGQGAVTAARIFGLAAAIYNEKQNWYAQSFPSFGTERRGAPVSAFTRLSQRPIRERSQVYEPDFIVILDDTLVSGTNVFEGLKEEGTIILNTGKFSYFIPFLPPDKKIYHLNATQIALDILKTPIVNTAMVGALAAVSRLVSLEAVKGAIGEILPAKIAPKNIEIATKAFETAAKLAAQKIEVSKVEEGSLNK